MFGGVCVEVIIDIMIGEMIVDWVDFFYDVGYFFNFVIDIG